MIGSDWRVQSRQEGGAKKKGLPMSKQQHRSGLTMFKTGGRLKPQIAEK